MRLRGTNLPSAQRAIRVKRKTHRLPLSTLSKSSQKSLTPFSSLVTQEKVPFQPETSAEFYRDWRRHLRSGPERYQALLQLGGPKLGHLFQTDVGFGLLGELLVTLADHVRLADRMTVLGVLRSLASTGRFTLNLSLLSHAEKESCRELFQKLQAMATSRPVNEGLCRDKQAVAEQDGGLQEEEGLLQELLGLYQMH